MRPRSRRILPLILVALSAAVSPRPTIAGEPYLPPTSPENVIRNMERAYANRDAETYSACLAGDFQFSFGDGSTAVKWGRDEDVRNTTHLFASKEILSLRLVFSLSASNPEGSSQPDGLIRVEVTQDLSVEVVKKDPGNQDFKINGSGIFFFRNESASDSEPHFVIARWVDPGTTGSK